MQIILPPLLPQRLPVGCFYLLLQLSKSKFKTLCGFSCFQPTDSQFGKSTAGDSAANTAYERCHLSGGGVLNNFNY